MKYQNRKIKRTNFILQYLSRLKLKIYIFQYQEIVPFEKTWNNIYIL